MLVGLLLAAASAASMPTALFQRKSRSGWLEELDGIREDALDQPDGEVGHVVPGEEDDIWTDLRDGGSYDNPHEISSLYANDDTPDDPTPKPVKAPKAAKAPKPPKAPKAAKSASKPPSARSAAPAEPGPTLLPPPPGIEPLDPGASAPRAERPPIDPDQIWVSNHDAPTPPTQYDTDQIWVQPAPHPIRPSEMWHPAELAPPLLGEESEPIIEERVASAELREVNPIDPGPAPDFGLDPAVVGDVDHELVQAMEAELVAAAEVSVAGELAPAPTPAEPTITSAPGLVAGPVGRRVRRDRPVERKRSSLPPPAGAELSADDPSALVDRGEQSPLPVAPLAPAALPTRSNRLPGIEQLPATPSSVVAPRSMGPFDQAATDAAFDPAPAPPAAAEPPFDPAGLVVEEVAPAPAAEPAAEVIEPAATEPVAPPAELVEPPAQVIEVVEAELPAPTPAPEPAIPVVDSSESIEQGDTPLVVTPDGMVPVAGTIVRIGGARQALASLETDGASVALAEGWCWVSPGEGSADPVHVDMLAGRLTVAPGSTALAVVESDGSAFVIVADGTAVLRKGADRTDLPGGSIAMVDPAGGAQVDQANHSEIEADPIVAENLSLDAEL